MLVFGTQVGILKPERSIPDTVLKGACGLAIITVFKAGFMMTYKFGTGLVVSRRRDGSWSAPSAIASCGLGWGAQVLTILPSVVHCFVLYYSYFRTVDLCEEAMLVYAH